MINVTDIDSKRKKKKKGTGGENDDFKPPQRKEILGYLLKLMRLGSEKFQPPFMNDQKPPLDIFIHKKTNEQVRLLKLNHENATCYEIDRNDLFSEILNYCSDWLDHDELVSIYHPSIAEAEALTKAYMVQGREVKEWPQPCGFKSSPGVYFHRLPYDPIEGCTKEQFPFIAQMLDRMVNSKAFCQRVGSIFDYEADHKQSIWLWGPGDSGKSTIFDILEEIAGKTACVALDEDVLKGSFGIFPLVDKRVGLCEEFSPEFFKSSKFKIILGGASVQVNPKGKNQFTAKLNCILFFNSNESPTIPNDSGLTNRIISCEIHPIPFEERIGRQQSLELAKKEIPYFLSYCLDLYSEISKGGRIIPDSTKDIDDGIDSSLEAMIFSELFLEDLSALGRDAKITSKDFREKFNYFKDNNRHICADVTIKSFEKYVKNRLNLSHLSVNIKNTRFIPGIRRKPN